MRKIHLWPRRQSKPTHGGLLVVGYPEFTKTLPNPVPVNVVHFSLLLLSNNDDDVAISSSRLQCQCCLATHTISSPKMGKRQKKRAKEKKRCIRNAFTSEKYSLWQLHYEAFAVAANFNSCRCLRTSNGRASQLRELPCTICCHSIHNNSGNGDMLQQHQQRMLLMFRYARACSASKRILRHYEWRWPRTGVQYDFHREHPRNCQEISKLACHGVISRCRTGTQCRC